MKKKYLVMDLEEAWSGESEEQTTAKKKVGTWEGKIRYMNQVYSSCKAMYQTHCPNHTMQMKPSSAVRRMGRRKTAFPS